MNLEWLSTGFLQFQFKLVKKAIKERDCNRDNDQSDNSPLSYNKCGYQGRDKLRQVYGNRKKLNVINMVINSWCHSVVSPSACVVSVYGSVCVCVCTGYWNEFFHPKYVNSEINIWAHSVWDIKYLLKEAWLGAVSSMGGEMAVPTTGHQREWLNISTALQCSRSNSVWISTKRCKLNSNPVHLSGILSRRATSNLNPAN